MSSPSRGSARRSDGTPDSGFDHDANDLNSRSSDPNSRTDANKVTNQRRISDEEHDESNFHDSMPESHRSSADSSTGLVQDVTILPDQQNGSLSGGSLLSSSRSYSAVPDVTRFDAEEDTDQQSVAGDAFECTTEFENQERLAIARSEESLRGRNEHLDHEPLPHASSELFLRTREEFFFWTKAFFFLDKGILELDKGPIMMGQRMSSPSRGSARRSDGTPDSGFDHDANDLNSRSSDPNSRTDANKVTNQRRISDEEHDESNFHDSMPESHRSSADSSTGLVRDVTILPDQQNGSLSGGSLLSSSRSYSAVPDVTRFDAEEDTDQQSVAGDAFECTTEFENQERLAIARSEESLRGRNEHLDHEPLPHSTGTRSQSTCALDSTNESHLPHHWSSTPVALSQQGSSNHSRSSTAQNGVVETSIMVPRRPAETRSSASSNGQGAFNDDSSHFRIHTTGYESSSTNDGRRYLGRDLPLNQAFPQKMENRFAPTSVLPSQSTRHLVPQLRVQDKRVNKLKKDVGMNVPSPVYEASTSSDFQETPVQRQRLMATRNDAVPRRQSCSQCVKSDKLVRALVRQLKDAVAHIDLVESFQQTNFTKFVAQYEDAMKAVNESNEALEEEKSEIKRERKQLEDDKRKHDAEVLKLRNQNRKTVQGKVVVENEAIDKLKTQLQKSCTENSTLRVKLQTKEKEFKELKEQVDKLTESKESLTRTLNLKTKNNGRELAAKEKEIKELNQQLAAAQKRKPGIQPRQAPVPSPKPLANVSNRPVEPVPTLRQVHFEDKKNQLHIFNNDDTYSDESGYFDEMVLNTFVTPTLEKGDCWHYKNLDGSKSVDVFRIQHSDGSSCGALQYQYREMRDARWVFGDQLEVYHYGRHRVEVNLKSIGVQVRGSYYGLEILRRNSSISHYSFADKRLVETLPRKDGKEVYALVFSPSSSKPDVSGNCDRNILENEQVIRRGSLNDPIEHVDRHATNPNIITWQSHRLNAEIVDYMVVADAGIRGMKMKITFRNGQMLSIQFNPHENQNWVIIQHIDEKRYVCCDMGSKMRERERKGIYINCDSLDKYS